MVKRRKGLYFEAIAKQYIERKGFSFLKANLYSLEGEIDLIFFDGKAYRFVEVKSITKDSGFSIYETLSRTKLKRIYKSVKAFLNKYSIHNKLWQVDFLGIIIDEDILEIEYFENLDVNSR